MKRVFFALMYLCPLLVFSQAVGINTDAPTVTLDVNGDIRLRQTLMSKSPSNAELVADIDGVVKKALGAVSRVRGYLSQDFVTDATASITKVMNFNIIDDPSNDFDISTSIFTPSYSGIYNIVITSTTTAYEEISTNNSVFGLVDGETGKWVMRFSVPRTYIESLGLNNSIGISNTFKGAVLLTEGKPYYFGASKQLKILYNPTSSMGDGLATYFSIELLRLN